MFVVNVFFLIFFLVYALFLCFLMVGWRRIRKRSSTFTTHLPVRFSIVIAIRNEAQNLPVLFKHLLQLQFSTHRFEIILVNDHSQDASLSLMETFAQQAPFQVLVYNLPQHKMGKKAALSLGIAQAQFEVIATTDADCVLPTNWLLTFEESFQNPAIQFCAGAVLFDVPHFQNTFFKKFQQLEFLSLMGSGAAIIGLNRVLMCNGANMAFRKTAYLAVGGHERNAQFASGDDVFLLHEIKKLYPKGIDFLTHPAVITAPPPSFRDFWHQRLRWAGKANSYQNRTALATSIFVFLAALLFLMAHVFVTTGWLSPFALMAVILLKVFSDAVFIYALSKYYRLKFSHYFLMIYWHPIYILAVAIAAPFAQKVPWKNRPI